MSRLEQLRQAVKELYEEKREERAEWCDWMYAHHVFIVADNAAKIAEQHGANPELAEAAAMLHDIADVKMERADPQHEEESLKLARQLLKAADYSRDEIRLIVDDAIRLHSCHGNQRPESPEGLVLATADSLAHLQTDFYAYATWAMGKRMTIEETKTWVLTKIERDFYNKISFDEERELARKDYELIKDLFSR